MDKSSFEESIGGLFFIGLPGPDLDQSALRLLESVRPSGVCLFARNIKSPQQVRELTDGIRSVIGERTLISIDQEGGRVDRLRRILEPMPAVEQLRSIGDISSLADITSRALLNLGINMNFAPVVDVNLPSRESSTNGLATRMFGTSAEEVHRFAKNYVEGLSAHGLKSCVKHFPGLGGSRVDSHEELPFVEVTAEESEADLLPYKTLDLNAEETAVMVAHAFYIGNPLQGTTDDGGAIPSSIGGRFISELLRKAIGFDGVVITDDLEMGAIMRNFGIEEACVMAVEAGNDQLLICNEADNIVKGFESVTRSAQAGRLSAASMDRSLERVELIRTTLPDLPQFDGKLFDTLSEEIRTLKTRLA